ncbi:WPE palindromic element domain-containing protein [Wolbachia endosymbiont of Nomada ferruginata]|nr:MULTISPECIES: WPE palindromic element domain-containing protein [unclassified Wolbachia]
MGLREDWIPVSATCMTPSFFLDPSSQGTGMTKTVQSAVARNAGI